MKKLFNLIIITFVASFLIACSFNSSSPEAVAENYINYCAKGDIDKLLKLMDIDGVPIGEQAMRNKVVMMVNNAKSATEKRKGLKSVKAEKAIIDKYGVYGVVNVNIKYGNGEEVQESVKMVNRDGKWKISLDF